MLPPLETIRMAKIVVKMEWRTGLNLSVKFERSREESLLMHFWFFGNAIFIFTDVVDYDKGRNTVEVKRIRRLEEVDFVAFHRYKQSVGSTQIHQPYIKN